MSKQLKLVLLTLIFNQLAHADDFINLGSVAEYNAIVFGHFKARSSDVEGRMAVQGDVDINNYSVGDKLDPNQLHNTLISGGDINFPSGRVYYGNIIAAGDVSSIGAPVSNGMQPGSVITGNAALPIDFDVAFDELTALSQSLRQLTVNTTFDAQWGGLYLHGDCSSATQVFELDGNQVLDAHTFQVDCIPSDAYVIFNISGQNPGLTNMSMDTLSSHREKVIYNFYEAQTLTLSGIGFEGTILAPYADINNPQGVIKGQLIAQSWDGMMQINNNLFQGVFETGNQAPIAFDQSFDVETDEVLIFSLSTNEPNNDQLTFNFESEPVLGQIEGNAPNLTYTPLSGFVGVEQLTYSVSDGPLESESAVVTFNVGQTQCELYPLSIEQDRLNGIQPGDTVKNYATSVGAGNYSLLTWNGANDTNTLAASFTQPGDSYNFINPDDASDQTLSLGDWVQGAPGKNNARHVRDALDALLGESIVVPVWSETRGSGSNFDYEVAEFARIELTDYKLNGQSKISFIYQEAVNCGNFAPFTLDASTSTEQNQAVTFALADSEGEINGVPQLLAVIDADQDDLTFNITNQPAHGTLSGTGPEFTYTPSNGFAGNDSFDFKVNDGTTDSNVSTISITVVQNNQVPVADGQDLQLNENQAISITLTGTDPDNDSLLFNLETLPLNGQLTGIPPVLNYTPNTDFFGSDVFTFTVNDGQETSVPAEINIEVLAVNDAPIAADLSLNAAEDMPINLTLIGSDPDGDVITFQLLAQPSSGVLTGATPDLTYTPNTDFNGSDAFTYLVNDGELNSNVATVSITVNPANDAPLANDLTVTTDEDVAVGLTLSGSDPEGDALTFNVLSQPNNGTLSGAGDTYTYLPNTNFNGTDSFIYAVNDGELNSNVATVSITVNPANDAPLANDLTVTTDEDVAVGLTLSGSDPEGDALIFNVLSQPTNGVLSGTAPELSFTPHSNFNGTDSFTYSVNDAQIESNVATVNITVVATNDAPSADNISTSTDEDTSVAITLSGSDPDGDALSYQLIILPAHGTLSGVGANLSFTPEANFIGTDTFTYVTFDGDLESIEATVTVVVNPVNDAPIANDISISADEDTDAAITLIGSDPEDDVLTFSVLTLPAKGLLTGTAPDLIYTPDIDFNGADSFTYIVNDGELDSNVATVSITVNAANDAPIAVPVSIELEANSTVDITLSGSDVDGDVLSFELDSMPVNGDLTGSDDIYTYTPDTDYSGADSFTYHVNDGNLDSVVVTVDITVTEVNQAPEIVSVPVGIVDEQATYVYDVDAIDLNNDPIDYQINRAPVTSSINSGTGLLTANNFITPVQGNREQNLFCRSGVLLQDNFEVAETVLWPLDGDSYDDVDTPPLVIRAIDSNNDGQIDLADSPVVVFSAYRGGYSANKVVGVRADTVETVFINETSRIYPSGPLAAADLDGDGLVEIIGASYNRDEVVVLNHDGTEKFRAPISSRPYGSGWSYPPTVADIDQDGNPEILIAGSVLDSEGNTLWTHAVTGIVGAPILVDVEADGINELIIGGHLYDISGNLIWAQPIAINRNGGVYSAVANFDGDDDAEIITVISGYIYAYDHLGTELWSTKLPGGGRGGAPTVGQVNGQTVIGVAGAIKYTLFDASGAEIWSQPIQDGSSSITGSSMFDFNGDGRVEITYLDERYFRIYDALNGSVLFETPNRSHTGIEYPVIADATLDGSANILVPENGGTYAVRMFSGVTPWVNTRSIWNQYSYHIDNINEDGSVPASPNNSWQTHNTFRLNNFPDRSPLGAPDLAVFDLSLVDEDPAAINVRVVNRGLAPSVSATEVSIYNADPSLGGQLLGTINVPVLTVNQSLFLTLSGLDAALITDTLFAVVDENNVVAECIENNNLAAAELFEVQATDDEGLYDTQRFLVNVADVNNPPVIITSTLADAIAVEPYEITIEAVDGDIGDALLYELVDAPYGMSLLDTTGEIFWIPDTTQEGLHDVTIKVRDLAGATATQTYIITVLPPVANEPPVITSVPVTTAKVFEAYNYQVTATDLDGDVLTYGLTESPFEMSIHTETGVISWAPDISDVGAVDVVVRVTDGRGGEASQAYSINVIDSNQSPTAYSASYSTSENISIDIVLDANDPDGDALTYQILVQPTKGRLIGSGNLYTYTPDSFYEGLDSFNFIVNDSEFDSNVATVSLDVVSRGNNAPNIISEPLRVLSLVNEPLGEPELVNLSTWEVNDFDYDFDPQSPGNWIFNDDFTTVTQTRNARAGALLSDFNFSNQQISGTFSVQTSGDDDFIGFVFGFQNKYQYYTFAWKKGQQGNQLRGMSLWKIDLATDGSEGEPQFRNTDTEAGINLYQNDIGWQSFTNYQFNLSFQNEEISISVRNQDNGLVLDTFTIFDDTFTDGQFGFYNSSQPNVTYSGFDRQFLADETYFYDAEAVDPDGDVLFYELINSPSGMTIDSATGLITWVANTEMLGVVPISVLVTDELGATDIQNYDLIVSNDEPVIVSQPQITTRAEELYSYVVEVYDPNPSDVIVYQLLDGPAGMSITENTGQLTWSPETQDLGTYEVSIEVTDTAGHTDTQNYTLEVTAARINSAPVFETQPPLTATVGRLYTYVPEASDADGDPVTIALDTIPYDMQYFDGQTITWTPTSDQVTDHEVVLVAVDPWGDETEQVFSIQVVDVNNNRPPVINSNPVITAITEVNYQYQVNAFDPENDVLTYALLQAPQGMVIDQNTGLITWLPGATKFGYFDIKLQVNDGNNGFTQQDYQLTVFDQSANLPPVISSQPSTQVEAGELYVYDLMASDPEGGVIIYSLLLSPPGMTIDPAIGRIEWLTTATNIGSAEVMIVVRDSENAFVQQSYSIQVVTDSTGNQSPVITSSPVMSASINSIYIYDVVASDPDFDVLRYTLNNAPAGMQINSDTGSIVWTPNNAQVGVFEVEILVEDLQGDSATQVYSITVYDSNVNNPPSLTSTPGNIAKAGLEYGYQVEVSDPDGDLLNYQILTGPSGMAIDNNGLLSWTPSDTGSQDVVIRVDDGEFFIDQGWTVLVLDANVPLATNIIITPTQIIEGDEVTVQVEVLNAVDPVTVDLTIDGNPVIVDDQYQVTFTASDVGSHSVDVTVSDAYETVTQSTTYVVTSETASAYPEVDILSPNDGDIITGFNDISVRVQDDNLANWKLSYRYAEDDFTGRVTLAEGTGTVDDAVVANWDTSLLQNGIYVLLIEATDLSGQRSSIVNSVFLEGDLKLGHFSIAFEDMSIPVAGMPVTITRGYDTRDRNRDRAFGKGWSIGFQSVRVQESRIPGLAWFMETGFYSIGPVRLPRYCIKPAGQPLVSVVLPDGQVEKFIVKARTINPSSDTLSNCQNITPPQYFSIEFVPQGDTNSTITSSSTISNLNIINGNLQELDTFEPIDPNLYTLTMLDGTEYSLDQGFNVVKIKATTGHELRFTEDGIEHSGGLSVAFIRDTMGRITRIEKANGEGVDYAYDTNGDLVSFTDLNGNTTTFTYIQDHYLEDIIDPRGIRVARNEYDADGRLIAHIDADGNRIEYDNDLIAMTSTITDRRGNATVNAFDNAGNIIAQTNALGETTSYEYNNLRLETARVNDLGHRTEWTYDSQGNQLTEKDPLGHITTSTYNRKGELLTQVDALNQPVITNDYNPDYNPLTPSNPQNGYAQLNTVTDALGRTTQFHWVSGINASTGESISVNTGYTDASGNRYDISPISGGTNDGLSGASNDLNGLRTETTYDDEARPLTETQVITDEFGTELSRYTTTYEYNSNGDVVKMTDALGNITRTEYDALNKVSATIDALGRRTEMEYDDRGNQVLTRYPDGSTETMVYDAENNVIESTDRAGRVTKTIYDALNRVEAVIYPDETPGDDTDNPMTVNSYDAAGRLVAVSDAGGNVTSYEYDEAGRRTKTTDALLNETSSVYDALGRRTQSTDALGRVTTFEYNALGNLERTNFDNGLFTTVEYDQLSRKVAETDLAGLRTEYEYDAAGNLIAVIDALGQRTEYSYDQRGNKLTQTDARGNTTSWTYDALSRVTSRTLPMANNGNGVESYTYDAVGNRISKTDFNGDKTTYEYNNLNQLVLTTYSDATTVVNTYTITGQMETVTEVNGTTSYSYDSQDRLIRIDYPTGNYIEYSYDLNGNKTEVTTANQTVTNTYDELNRLKTVTDSSGTTTYTYDEVGNRASQINANGTVATYSYDALNRLEDLVHTDSLNVEIASYSYELGPNGNRLSLTEGTGRVVEYGYDALYRLETETVTDAINGNHFSQWSYDAVGNRLQQDIDGVVTTYTYNDNDHLLTETENGIITSYVYDANGNTLTKTVGAALDAEYTYSKDNRMLTANTNGSSISYSYDAGGIRQSQTVDGVITHYLVDPNRSYHQVLEEQDDLFIPQVLYTYGDDLISQTNDKGVHTFGYDGLGSTRILTDVTGTVQNSYGYQAFGELDYEYGSVENNYLFTGEQYDNNVGFYYLRARYYNPEIGRFHSMDVFPGMQFEPLSLHKYLYTHADPVNNIDPSGYFSLTEFAVSAAVASSINVFALAYNGNLTAEGVAGAIGLGIIEGIAFLGAAKVAFKGIKGLARATKSYYFNRQLERTFKLIKYSERVLPGFKHLAERMIINTRIGKVVFNSGSANGSVSGALKHMAGEVLEKSGKAGTLELAESLVITELREIAKRLPYGHIGGNGVKKHIMVRTEGGLYEVAAGIDKSTGLLKIYHLVPKQFF